MTNHPIVHLGSRASTRGWGQARQRSPGEPEQRGSGADSCGRVTAAAERALCLARGGRRGPGRLSACPPTLPRVPSPVLTLPANSTSLQLSFQSSLFLQKSATGWLPWLATENPPDTPTRFPVGDYHNGSIGTFRWSWHGGEQRQWVKGSPKDTCDLLFQKEACGWGARGSWR